MIVFAWYMYVCWTPDDTSDLIGHLTLVLTDWLYPHDIMMDNWHLILSLIALFTVYLCLHIITVLFQFIVSFHMLTHYKHMHFPFYFTHSLGLFLMTLNLHVQILNVFVLWTRYSMRLDMLRGSVVSFFIQLLVF